jgi:hypothetical protein
MKLHTSKGELIGAEALQRAKHEGELALLEKEVNKLFDMMKEDGLTVQQALVCISSLHQAILDTPAHISLKKLKEM